MTREIPLTQGHVAIVDDVDYELVEPYKWRIQTVSGRRTGGYARSHKKVGDRYATVLMHRLILDAPKGLQVDHANGDGLDNRRCNLRLATREQQGYNRALGSNNTSGYKGVSWFKRQGKWHAGLVYKGESIHLGYHDTPEDAANAYDEAARRYYGKFACTNFPEVPCTG